MSEKIGIMGGTFNPIHYGHLLLAEQAREELGLHKVLFVPSGNPYMKDQNTILGGKIRCDMVKLAMEGHPDFYLSTMEIEREGPTYTCDTLKELKEKNPENTYYLILGADSLLTLENWKKSEVIFQNAVIAAAVRGTGNEEKIRAISAWLTKKYQAEIHILPARFWDISSSEIRERLENGKSVRYMLPESVRSYIFDNHLYQMNQQGEK